MDFRRRQSIGWSVIALWVLLGGGWLAQLDLREKISTDVLDLVPADEREPELTLVRQLASQAEARAMLFIITQADGTSAPGAAAVRLAALLAAAPEFAQAIAMNDPTARDALGAELFARRFELLFPAWLARHRREFDATGGAAADFSPWLARRAVEDLDRFLSTPDALVFQELIPADPLLLLPSTVEQLKGGLALVQPTVAGGADGSGPARVWAQLAESPLSEAGQEPVFAAIARASEALRAEFPTAQVAYAGVNRFAAASRARIEKEVKWLNTLSLVAVLGVALAFIRTVHRGLHLVPVVGLATLGAWVGVTLAFERVHVLVFVLGSLLTGVAIDYGFYLFMQAPKSPGEDYWAKVRRLAKPLLASCLTTVAGFALLVTSALPMIRQLGVFVGVGLVSALVAAVVYFSTVRNPFLEARAWRGGQAFSERARQRVRRGLWLAGLVALPGLAMLTWRDDIRELEIPSLGLKREDAAIRAQFGPAEAQGVYLTFGRTLAEARAALEKFQTQARMEAPARELFSLGPVLPTPEAEAAARRFVGEERAFAEELRTALQARGFAPAEFTGFFAAYARYVSGSEGTADAAVRALAAKLSGPLGLLVHLGGPGELTWLVTLTPGHAAMDAAGIAREWRTVSVNQLESLNGVFVRYRQSALRLSLIGLGIVGFGVFLTYGWRDGVRIFGIPLTACVGVFGFLGWLGQPLNMFHLLGAFLGVCLTHNYSIFSATSAYRREGPPVSVRISALTTAASFGVLALSGIPVVRALGVTVALMVVVAMLLIEFEHLEKLGEK